jgi:glutamine synthetase
VDSPCRGGNGLKYDTFVDYDWGGPGQLGGIMKDITTEFTAARLFFNETDGSSFPNGSTRQTHRAAAFMNWDRVSPPFVRNGTLYIPAAFVTHNGDALDEKTPLLRSQRSINKEGMRLQKLLGDDEATAVVANVGWEQEFFAMDRDAYLARPDLVAANRMLVGAQPPRGQQTDFNYFNRMNPRVRAYMDEVTEELLKVGVPVTVFHNEVAPSQHEFCPIFKLTNVASDENVLAMELMEDIAVKHNLYINFHEKPFGGVNGSGKHNNWGLNTAGSGRNLFVPGKTEQDQASFIAMVACLARALHMHGDVIRVGVATAGNDHRLGAQEAPPAIISLCT